jgi:hypothetical protein
MNRQQQIDAFLLEAHRLALRRLRVHPERIAEVASTLTRWRVQAGVNRSDRYRDEWQALLDAGVDAVEAGACGQDEHAAALRNVSPLGVLITARERGERFAPTHRHAGCSEAPARACGRLGRTAPP